MNIEKAIADMRRIIQEGTGTPNHMYMSPSVAASLHMTVTGSSKEEAEAWVASIPEEESE